jgi:hypothetical protein
MNIFSGNNQKTYKMGISVQLLLLQLKQFFI